MRDVARLQNVLKRTASLADNDSQYGPTSGIVTSFDPKTQSAKVQLQPNNVETGYIPVVTQWAGDGWGMFSPPTVGSYVEVNFKDGSLDDGYIVARAHGDSDKPLPVPGGEFWLVHGNGQCVKLLNNSTIIIGGQAGNSTVLIGDTTALKALMTEVAMAVYNGHTHMTPSGVSQPPNQKMNATDHLTHETKAS